MFLTDDILPKIKEDSELAYNLMKSCSASIIADITDDITLLKYFNDIANIVIYNMKFREQSWKNILYIYNHYYNENIHNTLITMCVRLLNNNTISRSKKLNEFMLNNLEDIINEDKCCFYTIKTILSKLKSKIQQEHLLKILRYNNRWYNLEVKLFCDEYNFNYDSLLMITKITGDNKDVSN